MLAVVGAGALFLIAMFGTGIIMKVMDAFMPGGVNALKRLEMESAGKLMEKEILGERTANSLMIGWLREKMPQEVEAARVIAEREYKFQRETQIREQEFQLEMVGEVGAASREELVLSRLLPGGPTTGDSMGQSARDLLQATQGIPAMLPFDPNFPITALPGPTSRVGDIMDLVS